MPVFALVDCNNFYASCQRVFRPELEGKPFYLVYPENRRDDPVIKAIRDWVMEVPGGLCNGLERGADASEWFDSKSASPGLDPP